MSRTCLIGASGFVGSNLLRQAHFDDQFRSHNIDEIRGRSYSLLVCAGAPAAKWKANQNPQEDWANLERLIAALRHVKATTAILISTVDVFGHPWGVTETSEVDSQLAQPYGAHRYQLELRFRGIFAGASIVRLPGLFGAGLRKNFLFDLIENPAALPLTHHQSVFQFYPLGRLWRDLQSVVRHELELVHLTAEPVAAGEVARRSFDRYFTNETESPPLHYDMRSQFAPLLAGRQNYLVSAEETYLGIRDFAREQLRAVA